MSENLNHNNDSIDPESMDPERIIEAIEACRPGSDDAAEESLAGFADHADYIDLRSRIERIDSKIKKVFADVPVPAGLESRILAALADAPTTEESSTTDKPSPVDAGRKTTRRYRHWYLGASTVFVAASLLVALLLHITAAPPLGEDSLIQTAMSDFEMPLDGSPLEKQWPAVVEEFQPSADLSLSQCKDIHWKKLDGFLDQRGVVYSFITPDNARARLYVLESTGRIDLPNSPPRTPQGDTGGVLAAAWQTGDRLYVLVVDGSRRTYGRLLAPAGPLT